MVWLTLAHLVPILFCAVHAACHYSLDNKTNNEQPNKNKKAQRHTLNVQNQDMHMFSFPLSVSRKAWPLAEKNKQMFGTGL